MSKATIVKYKIAHKAESWLAQPGLVIYVEKDYDAEVNESIMVHLDVLKRQTRIMGYKFIYLPDFLTSCGTELYKYMTGKDYVLSDELFKRRSLKPILGMDVINQLQGPSLLFTGGTEENRCEVYQLQIVEKTYCLGRNRKETRRELDHKCLDAIFEDYRDTHLIFTICESTTGDDEKECYTKEDSDILLRSDKDFLTGPFDSNAACSINLDFLDKNESENNKVLSPFRNITLTEEESMVVEKVQALVERLLNEGMSIEAIMAFFAPEQKLSSIKITEDYRIILPEYNEMEIPLPAVQKAVYFLFLRHPEGINFKYMPDYRDELFAIYRKLALRGTTHKLAATVDDLVNPLSNAMNEKCSRIKNMFRYYLTENLAKHYYIAGEKGECKRIGIHADNILWMKDI